MPALVPQPLCDRAKLLLSIHSERTVVELTGISRNTLYHLKRRGFRAAEHSMRYRPRPSDFAIQCRHMGRVELAKHYRCSSRVITRWRRELGL